MTYEEIVKLAFLDELAKIHAARGDEFDLEKLSSVVDIDELIKEALLREAIAGGRAGLQRATQAVAGRVSPNQRFIQSVENIDPALAQTAKQTLKQQSTGARMERAGRAMRQTPVQRVQEAGLTLKPGEAKEITELTKRMGGTGGVTRMAGGTIEGAGAHMAHAPTWKKVINPIGIPMGGAFEGATRQAGREAVSAAGAAGAAGHARTAKALGRTGVGLQRAAPAIGQGAEWATMAATHAPSVAGLAGGKLVGAATGAKGFGATLAGKGVGAGLTKGVELAGRGALGVAQRI